MKADRSGPLGSNFLEAGAFVKSRAGRSLSRLATLLSLTLAPDYPEAGPPSRHGVTFTAYVNRPRSRGAVTLASADPLDRPIIDFNYLSEADDLRCAIAGVRWNLRILYAKAFDDIRGEEVAPGAAFRSDADLEVLRAAHGFDHLAPGGHAARWAMTTWLSSTIDFGCVACRAARRRRLDHADDRERQHQCADHHDRRKGGGSHSWPFCGERVMSPAPRPIYTEPDKRTSLEGLASHVPNGAVVAVGGGLSSREPMALLRAVLRRGVTGLTVVGSAHGIDIDLLAAGGALARSSESYVGFEQDFGLAPNYRRALESGAVSVDDSCCYTLVQQLRAAIQGLPFMPLRSLRGTSFTSLHPEYRQMVCPFTGEELLLVPAIEPDVALIHAQYGDASGNLVIKGPPVADILFAKASRHRAGDGGGDRPDRTAARTRRSQRPLFLRDGVERGTDGSASDRLLSLLRL